MGHKPLQDAGQRAQVHADRIKHREDHKREREFLESTRAQTLANPHSQLQIHIDQTKPAKFPNIRPANSVRFAPESPRTGLFSCCRGHAARSSTYPLVVSYRMLSLLLDGSLEAGLT